MVLTVYVFTNALYLFFPQVSFGERVAARVTPKKGKYGIYNLRLTLACPVMEKGKIYSSLVSFVTKSVYGFVV